MVCQELADQRDYNGLFTCALVSRGLASVALPLLYGYAVIRLCFIRGLMTVVFLTISTQEYMSFPPPALAKPPTSISESGRVFGDP